MLINDLNPILNTHKPLKIHLYIPKVLNSPRFEIPVDSACLRLRESRGRGIQSRDLPNLEGRFLDFKDLATSKESSSDPRAGGVRRLLRVRQLFVRPLRRPPLLGLRPRRVRLRQVHVQLRVGHARSVMSVEVQWVIQFMSVIVTLKEKCCNNRTGLKSRLKLKKAP